MLCFISHLILLIIRVLFPLIPQNKIPFIVFFRGWYILNLVFYSCLFVIKSFL